MHHKGMLFFLFGLPKTGIIPGVTGQVIPNEIALSKNHKIFCYQKTVV